ncbi:hypothetical protein A9Q84_16365 [Halobacteriovorax marinus]|uniref:NAD-dependent epimerase/dehydratase domain-containing protein n=1 Tax=Halobacteriovorax marinus TaxID=97084 RepID=A0A1Y5F4C2_9BACT|nr:hypothetical protein A9Q84_16365 [Halobacteriovorax marinus]
MKDERITIIGKGWLGTILYNELVNNGHTDIICTKRHIEKPIKHCMKFDLEQESLPDKLIGSILYFLIPIKATTAFLSSFCQLLDKIPKSTHFVFLGSTAVYSEEQGDCTEEVLPIANSSRAQSLIDFENEIIKRIENFTIIRSGGQYGFGRFPANSLKNKNNLDGSKLVNVIHGTDLVRILTLLISTQQRPRIINAVSPNHPMKKDFYQQQAMSLGFELHCFDERKLLPNGKVINSNYLKSIHFKFEN